VDIVYLSDAYVELLNRFPEVAPVLALGDKVLFKLGSAWVRIGEEGLTELIPEVLEQLAK
jgi:hypothetical protein